MTLAVRLWQWLTTVVLDLELPDGSVMRARMTLRAAWTLFAVPRP